MKVKIEVTAEDIQKGKKGDNWNCPIGLAGQRALTAAGLNPKDGVGTHDKEAVRTIETFARRFDKGEPVEPFEFEVDVVPLTIIEATFTRSTSR